MVLISVVGSASSTMRSASWPAAILPLRSATRQAAAAVSVPARSASVLVMISERRSTAEAMMLWGLWGPIPPSGPGMSGTPAFTSSARTRLQLFHEGSELGGDLGPRPEPGDGGDHDTTREDRLDSVMVHAGAIRGHESAVFDAVEPRQRGG